MTMLMTVLMASEQGEPLTVVALLACVVRWTALLVFVAFMLAGAWAGAHQHAADRYAKPGAAGFGE